jgi:hypothetical protein
LRPYCDRFYEAIFAGPQAQKRARDYFHALQTEILKS